MAMLRLTITGPIAEVAQAAGSNRQSRDALLTVGGETLPIQISPRGITRLKRDVCQFSPLRVSFVRAPGLASVFAGQKQLKLVTHCRATPSFQQYVLLEYAAYRLYNQLTPLSFRARLAMIDYVGDDHRPLMSRHRVPARGSGRRRGPQRRCADAATGERVTTSQLSGPDSARVALFEYMISNLDWSMRAGAGGRTLLPQCAAARRRQPAGDFAPVPYDFDFSGLVNPPYASHARRRRTMFASGAIVAFAPIMPRPWRWPACFARSTQPCWRAQ